MKLPFAILGMAHDKADIQAAIDASTFICERQIREGRAPLWWNDNARYAREEHATLPGVERIQTAEELHAMGRGDCDDHAPSLAASLRVSGFRARAVVVEAPNIGYHVIVVARDRNGRRRVIDPSARRGMLEREEVGAMSRRRRGKLRAMVARAAQLARQASDFAPGSRAARTLLEEARRLTRNAASELEQDDEGSDDE
jgi:hypothetical protein